MGKWIRKPPVRSGKLSNLGPAVSIPLGQKFSFSKNFLQTVGQKKFCTIVCKNFLKIKIFALVESNLWVYISLLARSDGRISYPFGHRQRTFCFLLAEKDYSHWIRKPLIRSSKLSNIGPTGSIPIG
jgi:hypothetical protein